MQHVLTPLGRQLRSVLATLSSGARPAPTPHHAPPTITRNPPPIGHAYHQGTPAKAASPAAASQDVWFDDVKPSREPSTPKDEGRSKGTRRLKRRTRRDYLSEALRAAGRNHVTPVIQMRKRDLSHLDVKRRGGREVYRQNARRHAADKLPHLTYTKELSLERLVASCIHHNATLAKIREAKWETSFRLAPWETTFLIAQGYTLDDVQAWAGIITATDSHEAFTALAERIAMAGSKPVPLFLLHYLLRRPTLNAWDLRLAIRLSWHMLTNRFNQSSPRSLPENAVFVMFLRLIRHAREVWPAAFENIVELLLRFLPRSGPADVKSASRYLERLTYMLNKAMHLLSMETAVEPYKDIVEQETGIIRILQFMTEHESPLQLNREGYRAVARIQLAQKKTHSDRQWAELKALSWPPWKQERTAMDADITLGYGMTRAGDTLRRMREAGYAALGWEKAAQLFAGWDTDGTPTIQTRTLLASGWSEVGSEAAIWAARVSTTRTAQEAWAAYLAFVSAKLPRGEVVILAMLRKLFAEEKRQRSSSEYVTRTVNLRDRLLPGDTREVEPLPPSTHLYTYTRTPVPTVEGFVNQLHQRHLSLGRHALAFVVANAPTLQLGFWYLRNASHADPVIKRTSSLYSFSQLSALPTPVLTAVIQLLCRFANVPLSKLPGSHHYLFQGGPPAVLDKKRLNPVHPLVQALSLAQQARIVHRPAWNAVLRALSNDATQSSMRFLLVDEKFPKAAALEGEAAWLERATGAVVAYGLVRRALSVLQDMHLDLDAEGFRCLCLALENTAFACWQIVRRIGTFVGFAKMWDKDVVTETHQLLRSRHHVRRLKASFRILVGYHTGGDTERRALEVGERLPSLPRLLHVPSAALLHAYIRALGWMGDHEGIAETVRWMFEYRTELMVQRARDRNAKGMMRKVIVAIRVFLERSWLQEVDRHPSRPDRREGSGPATDEMFTMREKNLRRLEAPASRKLVEEVEGLVNSVPDWRGWASDEEVERYCEDGRFRQIRSISL